MAQQPHAVTHNGRQFLDPVQQFFLLGYRRMFEPFRGHRQASAHERHGALEAPMLAEAALCPFPRSLDFAQLDYLRHGGSS